MSRNTRPVAQVTTKMREAFLEAHIYEPPFPFICPMRPCFTMGRYFGGFPLVINKSSDWNYEMKYAPGSFSWLMVYLVTLACSVAGVLAVQGVSGGGYLYERDLKSHGISSTDIATIPMTWIPHALSSIAYFWAYKNMSGAWSHLVQSTNNLDHAIALTKGTIVLNLYLITN